MKILIVTDAIYPFSMGGSHRLIYEGARALVAQGHTVVCIVPRIVAVQHSAHDGSGWVDSDALRIVQFDLPETGAVGRARAFFSAFRGPVERVLAEGDVDVVNVHYLPALVALRGLGRPIAYTFHGPWSAEFGVSVAGRAQGGGWLKRVAGRFVIAPLVHVAGAAVERWALRGCASYATISTYMREELARRFGVSGDRITVMPAGVNTLQFFPEPDPALRLRLSGGAHWVFLSVRRLERRMGLDNLIRAAALLRKVHPDFVLLIGGKGIQAQYLRKLIATLDCGAHVKLIGFIPDEALRAHLSAADLFVLPSRDLEGFGLVVLEAMACGTPVLVSPHGGAKEILAGCDPRLVLPGIEPEAIAERMAALMAGADLASLSHEALEVARTFTWDRFATRWADWLATANA